VFAVFKRLSDTKLNQKYSPNSLHSVQELAPGLKRSIDFLFGYMTDLVRWIVTSHSKGENVLASRE
jgi:hypothetical protein